MVLQKNSFSFGRLVKSFPNSSYDSDPMIKIRASTPTGTVPVAGRICFFLSIPLVLKQPRNFYSHGWDVHCCHGQQITTSWNLTILDGNNWPTVLPFDFFEDASSPGVGLDLERYSYISDGASHSTITFKQPTAVWQAALLAYILEGSSESLRLRI